MSANGMVRPRSVPFVGAEGLGSIELEGASDAIPSEVECRRHRYRD